LALVAVASLLGRLQSTVLENGTEQSAGDEADASI
jgi:hypothetical protein